MPVYAQPLIDQFNRIADDRQRAYQNARQEKLDERRARMEDLAYQSALMQMEGLKRKEAADEEIRSQVMSLSDKTSTTVTAPKMGAPKLDNPLANTLNTVSAYSPTTLQQALNPDLMAEISPPGPDASGFSLPQQSASPMVRAYQEGRVKTTTTKPDLMDIAIDVYSRHGLTNEAMGAKKLKAESFSLEDRLNEYAAQAKLYGSPEKYTEIKVMADRVAQASKVLKDAKSAGGLPMVKQVVAANPELFQGIDPNKIQESNGLMIIPYQGGFFWEDPVEGKMKFQPPNSANEMWGAPTTMNIGGKSAIVQQSSHGQIRPVIQDTAPKMSLSINAAGGGDIETLARGIVDGTIDPNAISKRGGLQAAVWGRVKQIDPKFDIVKAGVGAKWQGNTTNMNTKALLNTIDPLLQRLEETGKVLGNSSVPGYNKAVNFLKEQTGRPDIIGFNNLRDDVIAEVERGLMGTGVLSDSKYNRALKNINSAQSFPQLRAAVNNIRAVIAARLESMNNGPNAKPSVAGAPVKSGRFVVQEEK